MSSVNPYSFNRKNSLKLNSDIKEVFNSQKNIRTGILTIYYYFDDIKDSEIKVLISVPKRLLRKAHQRNLIKRRIKEAIRLNSLNIRQKNIENSKCLKFAVVYSSSIIYDYKNIEEKIILSLQKIYIENYGKN